jgi:hypothetical protein
LAAPNLLRLGKVQINLAILSTFRNIGFAEVTSTRQCKEKSFHYFPLHCPRLFVTLALPKLLPLGNAKKKFSAFSFALPSFIRNFALK